ncbi:hydrogenase maturation nickel metallochaperone HypA [Photobacterium frigidiphilum]|uniref:hydrogenase maturation nickel metallochaperone HypA n=1 Tax=Photobacterium frigidiphilum TaxID=264736 RepID=UPI003D0FBC13
MHELSISLNTVDTVVEHAIRQGFKRITAVTLGIGTLSCIEPQALQTGFEFACRGTMADGAALEIEMISARAWCQNCQQSVILAARGICCPNCQGYQLAIETGDELMIKHIEVE